MTVYRTADPDVWEPVYEPWDGPEPSVDDYNTVHTADWADDEDDPR